MLYGFVLIHGLCTRTHFSWGREPTGTDVLNTRNYTVYLASITRTSFSKSMSKSGCYQVKTHFWKNLQQHMWMTSAPTNHHLCVLQAWINPQIADPILLPARILCSISHQGHNSVVILCWTGQISQQARKLPTGMLRTCRKVLSRSCIKTLPTPNTVQLATWKQTLLFNDLLGFYLPPFLARKVKLGC